MVWPWFERMDVISYLLPHIAADPLPPQDFPCTKVDVGQSAFSDPFSVWILAIVDQGQEKRFASARLLSRCIPTPRKFPQELIHWWEPCLWPSSDAIIKYMNEHYQWSTHHLYSTHNSQELFVTCIQWIFEQQSLIKQMRNKAVHSFLLKQTMYLFKCSIW